MGPTRRDETRPAVQLHHVDVFTDTPMSGNGLAVVQSSLPLAPATMLAITRELRQFETIFLTDPDEKGATARIFTEQEELAFAGHPILGAAAVLHWERAVDAATATWALRVAERTLTVHTRRRRTSNVIDAKMNQGPATRLRTLAASQTHEFAQALGVTDEDVRHDLPCQVVTTGLPYLLLPVTGRGLAGSHVTGPDLTERLHGVGAKFSYVLDPDVPEGRTWDNRGVVEDVATGSAAGPAGAYLIEQGCRSAAQPFLLHQGRFVGRPSLMQVRMDASGDLWVGGPVVSFATGSLVSGFAPETTRDPDGHRPVIA